MKPMSFTYRHSKVEQAIVSRDVGLPVTHTTFARPDCHRRGRGRVQNCAVTAAHDGSLEGTAADVVAGSPASTQVVTTRRRKRDTPSRASVYSLIRPVYLQPYIASRIPNISESFRLAAPSSARIHCCASLPIVRRPRGGTPCGD